MLQEKPIIHVEIPLSENLIELPVGAIIIAGKVRYQVTPNDSYEDGDHCDYCEVSTWLCNWLRCSGFRRQDSRDVYYRIINKEEQL